MKIRTSSRDRTVSSEKRRKPSTNKNLEIAIRIRGIGVVLPYWLRASGSADLGFHLSDKGCQLDKINSLRYLTVRSTLENQIAV